MAGSEPRDTHPTTARGVEPLAGSGEPSASFRICPLPGGRWRVHGEIDLHNDDEWATALDQLVSAAMGVRLDVADLEFISARGVTQLVAASEKLPSGERIDVIAPRPLFRRILDSCWPDGVSGLLVVERAES